MSAITARENHLYLANVHGWTVNDIDPQALIAKRGPVTIYVTYSIRGSVTSATRHGTPRPLQRVPKPDNKRQQVSAWFTEEQS